MKNIIKKILRPIFHFRVRDTTNDSSSDLSWLKKYTIDSILDIGANEGQFLEKIMKVFPGKQTYCFEPLREVYKKLQTKTKDRQNVKVIQCAIGDENKEMSMNHCEFSPSSSLLKMDDLHKKAFPFTAKSQKEIVLVRKLDNIDEIRDKCKRPFIKIDTQGYEINVINGGLETFKLSPIIMIEVSYKSLYEGQPLFDDIYNKLTKMGFNYIGNIEQLLDPTTLQPLQADAIFENTKYEA
ncbi:MAG: FkbM family methyltransferase [Candidatus Paceibacterota bacterium]|jgi:FkbM family methyltransferase